MSDDDTDGILVEGVGMVVVKKLPDGTICDHVGKMVFNPIHCEYCGLVGEVIFSQRAIGGQLPSHYFKRYEPHQYEVVSVEQLQQPSDYVNDRPATVEVPLLADLVFEPCTEQEPYTIEIYDDGKPSVESRPAGHPVLAQIHTLLDQAGVPTHHPYA